MMESKRVLVTLKGPVSYQLSQVCYYVTVRLTGYISRDVSPG